MSLKIATISEEFIASRAHPQDGPEAFLARVVRMLREERCVGYFLPEALAKLTDLMGEAAKQCVLSGLRVKNLLVDGLAPSKAEVDLRMKYLTSVLGLNHPGCPEFAQALALHKQQYRLPNRTILIECVWAVGSKTAMPPLLDFVFLD